MDLEQVGVKGGPVPAEQRPEVGRRLAKGESFGSVESVKTVSDIYSPAAGEVIEVNGGLATGSEAVNSDPYGAGYLLRLRLDGDLPGDLLDAAAYQAEHGAFLGDVDLVWCPERLREADARLLGDAAARAAFRFSLLHLAGLFAALAADRWILG